MEVGTLPLHTGSRVLSPKYDMDAYMAILFGGEAWDFCWKLGRAKKLDSTLNSESHEIFWAR